MALGVKLFEAKAGSISLFWTVYAVLCAYDARKIKFPGISPKSPPKEAFMLCAYDATKSTNAKYRLIAENHAKTRLGNLQDIPLNQS